MQSGLERKQVPSSGVDDLGQVGYPGARGLGKGTRLDSRDGDLEMEYKQEETQLKLCKASRKHRKKTQCCVLVSKTKSWRLNVIIPLVKHGGERGRTAARQPIRY